MGGYVGIPVNYTPIEYIESTGTQYIDTGTKVHSNYKIELEISNFASTTGSSWRGVCGSRTANGASDRHYIQLSSSNYFTFAYGSSDGNFSSRIDLMNKTLITIDKNVAKIGNASVTATSRTFTSAYTYYLFSINNANSAVDKCSYRLHSFKIYNPDNVLVKDFIPVLNTDNVACLYEKIESKFYYNKGTGNFIAGNVIGEIVPLGGRARQLKSGYVGINNKARKIIKGYVGVDGVARKIYSSASLPDNTLLLCHCDNDMTNEITGNDIRADKRYLSYYTYTNGKFAQASVQHGYQYESYFAVNDTNLPNLYNVLKGTATSITVSCWCKSAAIQGWIIGYGCGVTYSESSSGNRYYYHPGVGVKTSGGYLQLYCEYQYRR